MLAHLADPKFGDYEDWLRISFAVYDATDSMGLEIWDRWCQQLPGYDAEENARKWDTFGGYDRDRRITVGTLIKLAREHGYQPPVEALRAPLPDVHELLAGYLQHRSAR